MILFLKNEFVKNILNIEFKIKMLLILICVIILVLLTCLRFELDLSVEGLSSIFSVGELGQETVVAAFLQKYREK